MDEAVDDTAHAPEWAARPSPRARQLWRAIVLSVAYVAVYLVLDRISFIEPLHAVNITPWNPSTGVMLALLIVKGVRWSPIVLVAELISGATLPQIPILPAPLFVAAIVVTVGYASAATILRHVRFDASLQVLRCSRASPGSEHQFLPGRNRFCSDLRRRRARAVDRICRRRLSLLDRRCDRHRRIHPAAAYDHSIIGTPRANRSRAKLASAVGGSCARGEHRRGTSGGVFADRRRSSPWGLLRAVSTPYLDCHASRCGGRELGSACDPSRVNRRVGDSGPIGGFASRPSTSDVRVGFDRPHAWGGGERAAPLVARPCRERKSSSSDPEYRAGWRPDGRRARKDPVDQPGGRTAVRASGQPPDRTRRS